MIYFLLIGIITIALVCYDGVVQERTRQDFNKIIAMYRLADDIQFHCVRYQLDDGDCLCIYGDLCVTWKYYLNDYAFIRKTLASTGFIKAKDISNRLIKKWYFLVMCQLHLFLVCQIDYDLGDDSGRSDEFKEDLKNLYTKWKEEYKDLMAK